MQVTEWNSNHAKQLRDYLASGSGQALLEILRDDADEQKASGATFEEVALNAKEADGMRSRVSRIRELSRYVESPTQQSEFVNVDV